MASSQRATDPADGLAHWWTTPCDATTAHALCPGRTAELSTLRNPEPDDANCPTCQLLAHGTDLADRQPRGTEWR